MAVELQAPPRAILWSDSPVAEFSSKKRKRTDLSGMSSEAAAHPEGGDSASLPSSSIPAEAGQPALATIPPTGAAPGTLTAKKRRSAKHKLPAEIKRSVSTPHMRQLALGDTGGLSPTDKRRNKLGYHRTSVACGHCRRRKIRCLLAPDDPQGRCSNCIRLKKECNFYPVEQQPPSDQRASLLSKGDGSSAALSASTASSPRASSNSAQDLGEDGSRFQNPLRSHTFPSVTGSDGVHHMHYSTAVPSHNSAYPPPQASDQSQWPPYSFGTSAAPIEDLRTGTSSPGYWRPMQSPSAFPSHSVAPAPPASIVASQPLAYGHSREGGPFPPPMRSLSYGNLENIGQNPPVNQWQSPDYHSRPPSYPYPPPLDTRSSSVTTLVSEAVTTPVSGPISAPAATQPFSPFGYQQQWSPYAAQHPPTQTLPSQPHESYTSHWYAEPASLGKVEEENQSGAHYQAPPFYQGPYNPG